MMAMRTGDGEGENSATTKKFDSGMFDIFPQLVMVAGLVVTMTMMMITVMIMKIEV